MLTKEYAICRYDFQHQRIIPDRRTTKEHAHYLNFAERMLEVYRTGTGSRRRELHRALHAVFGDEPDCPQRRIDAFCKLLDDQSRYSDAGRRDVPRLRRQVFRRAAKHHPLVIRADDLFEQSAEQTQAIIVEELGRSWWEIRDELFADVIDFQRLEQFEGYPDARSLLSRYNVAQIQAALYSSVSMNVEVTADFKRILRSARLAKLMHTIVRTSPGTYIIRLDGPASVLRETRRYGIQMAKFLPTLISCTGWRMRALIETRSCQRLTLELSERDRLQSHLAGDDEFDSSIESEFAAKWGNEMREGWCLEREGEFLHSGQKTFVPDFVFRHQSGCTVLMEIVGFWTPEYLDARLRTLEVFRDEPIVLAIHESTAHHFTQAGFESRSVTYKTTLLIKPVLELLNSKLKSPQAENIS